MGARVIEAVGRSSAMPEVVHDVLVDLSSWPRWGIWSRVEIERPGPDPASALGQIRVLTSRTAGRTIVSRELVTELEPGRVFGYRLLSGLPLRNYQARVELTPDGDGGTAIRWTSRFDRATFGLTWVYSAFFARFLADLVDRLARYAEQECAAS